MIDKKHMLKRDFIMVQIEELGKVIAQLISQRHMDAARRNTVLIQTVHDSLKTSTAFLLDASPDEISEYLNGTDMAGLQRMEIAAKLLLEESYLQVEKQEEMQLKAKAMLEYIQTRDTTFSLERMDLLKEIEQSLTGDQSLLP
jgi:hypothetical protein